MGAAAAVMRSSTTRRSVLGMLVAGPSSLRLYRLSRQIGDRNVPKISPIREVVAVVKIELWQRGRGSVSRDWQVMSLGDVVIVRIQRSGNNGLDRETHRIERDLYCQPSIRVADCSILGDAIGKNLLGCVLGPGSCGLIELGDSCLEEDC